MSRIKLRFRRTVLTPIKKLQPKCITWACRRVYTPETLKAMRMSMGWSQGTVATYLGVHTSTLCRWEAEDEDGRPIPIMAATLLSLLLLAEAGQPVPPLLAYMKQPVQESISEKERKELLPWMSPKPATEKGKRAKKKKLAVKEAS